MDVIFEFIIVVCLFASAIISLIDILFFAKARKLRVMHENPNLYDLPKKERQELLRAPLLADYARSLFPVFLLVFILRQFIFGLYIVPTGSMLPTIQLDDFLYVNKLAYAVHMPFSTKPLHILGQPARGDIAVFDYPANPNVEYIKTIVGLPGDHITYKDKQLYINGKKLPKKFIQQTIEPDNANLGTTVVDEYQEQIGDTSHHIYQSPKLPAGNFENLVVPQGKYFAMGDNRDNSDDSRSWGFVPADYLVGKAEMIWFSWDAEQFTVRWHRLFQWLP